MREIGVVRWRLGDTREEVEAAKPYLGQARLQLGILKNLMAMGGQQQGARAVTLPDGTVIRSQSVMGQDIVSIAAPTAAVAVAVARAQRGVAPLVLIANLNTSGPFKNGHEAVWDHDLDRMLVYSGFDGGTTQLAAHCNSVADSYILAVREEYIVHSIDPPSATYTVDSVTYSVASGQALDGLQLPTITFTPATSTDELTSLPEGPDSWSSVASLGAWYSYGAFGEAQADRSDTVGGLSFAGLSFAGPMLDANNNTISSTIFPNLLGGAADFFADVIGDAWGIYYSQTVRYWYREASDPPVARIRADVSIPGVYPPNDWMNHSDAVHYADGKYDIGKSNTLWQWTPIEGWTQLPNISYAAWQEYLVAYGGSVCAAPPTNPLVAALQYGAPIGNTTYVKTPGGRRYAFGGTDGVYSGVRYIPGTNDRPPALNALVEYYFAPL